MSHRLALLVFAASIGVTSGQEAPARRADTPGTALLPADSAPAFKLSANAGEFAKMSTVTVTGQPFSSALRIDVTKKPQRPADLLIAAPVDGAVASGDVLLVSFWMRSATSAEATLDAGFRTASGAAPPAGAPAGRGRGGRGGFFAQPSLNAPAVARSSWRRVQFPFAVTRAYDKGQAELFSAVGLGEQSIEIGGIELVNYASTRKAADLPFTKLGYSGSEPNAAWRKAAEERIETIRKGDLTVLVKDSAGKPVRNAQVSVRMRKYAFIFGTAVSGGALSSQRLSAENLTRYKQEILQLFNFAVMENEMKWPQWANESSRPATLAAVDWLRENGLQLRGHNLVWPSWRNTNVKAAVDAKNDPAALAKVITDHISETTLTAFRGRLVDWDVINETFTNHDFMDILGRHAMVDWFKAASRRSERQAVYQRLQHPGRRR